MGILGLVTIGQAPRTDVTPDILPLLAGIDVVEHGALDDLDEEQIAALRPAPNEPLVVSRLRSGESVVMSEERVLTHVRDAVDRAIADRADAVLVLCTGRLPGLSSAVPVYTAEQLARRGMHARAGDHRLGVLVPEQAQCVPISERWRSDFGREVVTTHGHPYTAAPGQLTAAGVRLADAGAEWIFLDCIGYSESMAGIVAEASGAHVITARSMAARLVAAAI